MRTNNRRGIVTMAAAAALVTASGLAVATPASAAAPPQDSQRFERSYQQNDYSDRSMRSGPYRTPQAMEQEAYRQGFEAGRHDMRNQSRYNPGAMHQLREEWELRRNIPPSEWGAWRDRSTPEERAYRAWPQAEAGTARQPRNSDTRYDTYRAWPGVEAGNYR